MPERYTGSWTMRLGLLMPVVCGFGTFYFFVVLMALRVMDSGGGGILVASVPFGAFGFATALVCLYGIAESFSVYLLDERGIQKVAFYGAATMAWADVADVRTSGATDDDIGLVDRDGHRLTVWVSLARPGKALRASVLQRVAPLLEARERELGWKTRTYRPARDRSIFAVPFAFLGVGFALMPMWDPRAFQGSPADVFGWVVVGGLVGLGFTALGLHMYTWVITVSPDAIASRSLFINRRIPFGRLQSFLSRDVTDKNGTHNFTTITGGGQTITFSDVMPDYALVQDFIRSHVGPTELERGKSEADKRNRREGWLALGIIAWLLALGLGIAAVSQMQDARARLALYARLERAGVRTEGVLDGRHTTPDSAEGFVLDYQFEARGRTFHRSSPVSTADYFAARAGQPVSVVYLPSDPDEARTVQSIGPSLARSALRHAYTFAAVACLYTLALVAALLFRWTRRPHAATPQPA